MKRLLIPVIFFLLTGIEARAQSLADAARAERLRQQNVESTVKVQKAGDKPVAAAEEDQKAETVETPTEPKKEITQKEKLRNERVDIVKKRSELLVRMDEVKHDPLAVKAIEAELIGLSRRAESAKLQHLGKNEQPAQ